MSISRLRFTRGDTALFSVSYDPYKNPFDPLCQIRTEPDSDTVVSTFTSIVNTSKRTIDLSLDYSSTKTLKGTYVFDVQIDHDDGRTTISSGTMTFIEDVSRSQDELEVLTTLPPLDGKHYTIYNQDYSHSLDDRVIQLESDSTSTQSDVDTNTNNISTNSSLISNNKTNIDSLTARVGTNESDITSLQSSISSLNTSIASNVAEIQSNDTDISNLQSNVSSNQSSINSLESRVFTNENDISSNETSISTNATNISSLTSTVSSNTLKIGNNTSSIDSLNSSISSNTNSINSLNTSKEDKLPIPSQDFSLLIGESDGSKYWVPRNKANAVYVSRVDQDLIQNTIQPILFRSVINEDRVSITNDSEITMLEKSMGQISMNVNFVKSGGGETDVILWIQSWDAQANDWINLPDTLKKYGIRTSNDGPGFFFFQSPVDNGVKFRVVVHTDDNDVVLEAEDITNPIAGTIPAATIRIG